MSNNNRNIRRPGSQSSSQSYTSKPTNVKRPRAKRPAVLLDERERRALSTPSRQERQSSNLGLWLMMIPLTLLLLLSLFFNYSLYRNARERDQEILKLSREFSILQEEAQPGLARIDAQQNEIEQLKQAVKTLKDWITEGE
ncbi:MAG: hypothetical protein Q4P65_01835 [Eubacteriales bacterium]|nr:hypothetical protein [Eubacteriales bacterium]